MNTPDKCPHCGADLAYSTDEGSFWSTCGSTGKQRSDLCKERAAHAETKRELNTMRESRDEANERLAALNEWVGCHAGELSETKRELEAAKSCVEVQHRAFADFISAAQNSCKGCRGGGQDNDGEAYTGEPCPDCKWITMAIPDFMMDPSIQAKLNAEKVSEVECLRARVAELEGLEVTESRLAYNPPTVTVRLRGGRIETWSPKTLGEAMPAKEIV